MIRMTRLTDYAIVLLTHIARDRDPAVHNSRDLAAAVRLPLPTVNKVLKTLTRKGLLLSHRGVKGGYRLARSPEDVSVAEIISATEGPVAITECSTSVPDSCEHEGLCPLGENWQRINQTILDALDKITLSEMAQPAAPLSHVTVLRPHVGGVGAS